MTRPVAAGSAAARSARSRATASRHAAVVVCRRRCRRCRSRVWPIVLISSRADWGWRLAALTLRRRRPDRSCPHLGAGTGGVRHHVTCCARGRSRERKCLSTLCPRVASARRSLSRAFPSGGSAAPADVARAVLFFAAEDSGFITGRRCSCAALQCGGRDDLAGRIATASISTRPAGSTARTRRSRAIAG